MPQVDGSFRVLIKVNDNAYMIDLPGEFNVLGIFKIRDLTPSVEDNEESNLRLNPI